MSESIVYLGLDVHSTMIVAVAVEEDGREQHMGSIPNSPSSLRRLVKKLGAKERIRAVYEAGPTGYALHWELSRLGVSCQVAAPSLIPTKSGDRVKTDRRDARKLARYHRSGDLSYVRVPEGEHESLRDLVRARYAAKGDEKRARQRVKSFLLRHGLRAPKGVRAWTVKYRSWLDGLNLEPMAMRETFEDYLHEVDHQALRVKRLEGAIDEAVEQAPEQIREVIKALESLRGVRRKTAVAMVAEVWTFSRFAHPVGLMGYSGAVPSEWSTGGPDNHKRGPITKTGNSHVRRLVVESAWSYRFKPSLSYALRKRQEGQPAEVVEIAWRAQLRLCSRYRRLTARGKEKQKVVTAVARELLGFMWAIGVEVEKQLAEKKAA